MPTDSSGGPPGAPRTPPGPGNKNLKTHTFCRARLSGPGKVALWILNVRMRDVRRSTIFGLGPETRVFRAGDRVSVLYALSGPLAFSDSRILSFGLGPETPQNPAPGGRIPAPRTR